MEVSHAHAGMDRFNAGNQKMGDHGFTRARGDGSPRFTVNDPEFVMFHPRTRGWIAACAAAVREMYRVSPAHAGMDRKRTLRISSSRLRFTRARGDGSL